MRPLPGRAHFRRRLADPGRHQGRQGLSDVVDVIATQGVTWIHSYVAGEGRKNFCVNDGPNAEAIRATAERNGLPVDPPSGALANVPAGLAGSYRWLVLLGDGLSGFLTETGDAWCYKQNEGGGRFGARQFVTGWPAYALGQVSLVDFDADGDPNLALLHGREVQELLGGGAGRC